MKRAQWTSRLAEVNTVVPRHSTEHPTLPHHPPFQTSHTYKKAGIRFLFDDVDSHVTADQHNTFLTLQ